MPRLSVVAGPSLDALVPISVNSGIPHNIVSDAFEGQILAYVKGFTDDELQNEYFQREERRGITWSIQTQGNVIRLDPCPPIPPPRCVDEARSHEQDVSFALYLQMTCSLVTRSTVP
jgi:hypothetical protein